MPISSCFRMPRAICLVSKASMVSASGRISAAPDCFDITVGTLN